jgi:hypothetical protein
MIPHDRRDVVDVRGDFVLCSSTLASPPDSVHGITIVGGLLPLRWLAVSLLGCDIMKRMCFLLVVGSVLLSVMGVAVAEDFPVIYNTQNKADQLTAADRAVAAMRVPDGFRVSLVAAEPDVQQPISITTDDRGRLWVV